MFAPHRHDKSDWDSNDPNSLRIGQAMVHACILIEIKADRCEYAPTIGLPTWGYASHPCKDCFVERAILCHVDQSYVDHLPFVVTTERDYEDACRLCERRVYIPSKEAHARMRAALFFDNRKKGGAGRCLRVDLPEFGLNAGDRLEPSTDNPDIIGFDEWVAFPRYAMFWRPSLETMTRHRNPMFSIEFVSHELILIDILHAVYLGVAQVWILGAFWKMMDDNAFGVVASDRATRNLLTVARIKVEIMEYYKWKRKTETISEIETLTLSMISPRGTTGCFKGAERKHLIGCVLEMLHRRGYAGTSVLKSGLHLQNYIYKLDVVGNNPDERQCRDLRYHAVMHMTLATRSGIAPTPKYHQLLHMAWNTYMSGNPNLYANWVDEGLNKTLARICAAAHEQVWAARVFTWWNQIKESSERVRTKRIWVAAS